MMVGDVLADRYELEELVGAGGMSQVYRALDRKLDRRVALKILHKHFGDDEEYVERFLREARTVAGLSHPNIVTVIDRGDHDGRQFIVFEYVHGESLKQAIQRSGPAPVERALELGIQIARGLHSAHERGLIHRDVKPQNVLLNGNGEAKVTDFGIARELDVVHGMTQTGTVLGTSDYISPEQAQGRRVDEQTDVYSLGVVLYELITGELPFVGNNFVAVAMGHINDPAPSVLERRPDVPPRVAAAIARALAKEPADRWPSMADFGRELQACLREAEAEGGADGDWADNEHANQTLVLRRPVRAPGPRRRRIAPPVSVWTLLAGAGLIVLAAVLAIALLRGDDNGGTGLDGAEASPSTPVALSGLGAFDPSPGDGREHDDDAPSATDGSEATYWTTESYLDSFAAIGKSGVGLVLDAGRSVTPDRLVVTTDTPGFTATIQAGDSPSGPFHDVSGSQTVAASTTFDLTDAQARYFVVWITDLGSGSPKAHVNEVTAS
jgi:tRNA A-37 threonylcarbamoyl transferase component Bud32